MNKIKSVFNHASEIDVVLRDPTLCTHLLLDSSHPSVDLILQPSSQQTPQIELYSCVLIFRLPQERTKLFNTVKSTRSNRKAMNRNWSNQKANPALKTKTGNK